MTCQDATDRCPQVVVRIDPAFGPWTDREVTPEMVRGKLLWVTSNITRLRREVAAAEKRALSLRHDHEDELARAVEIITAHGAVSQAEVERRAARIDTVRSARREREIAELAVKHLRDELEEMYRAQMPATQSLNRIVLGLRAAEWAGLAGEG